MRAISYLRVFNQTRYLVRMIIEVVKDMIAFMAILLITTSGFMLIIYEESQTDLFGSFREAFLLNFGEFN